EAARSALGLDRVLFLPAGEPPHKAGEVLASVDERVAMVEAAIAGHPGFELSRTDVDRPGPSWTADSMERIRDAEHAAGRDPELYLVMSTETLAEVPGWHDPARLLDACRLAVVPRAGVPAPDPAWIEAAFPGRADRIVLLPGPSVDVSSTGVRATVGTGGQIHDLVPDAVERQIVDHGLYQPDAPSPEDPDPVTESVALIPRPDGLPRRQKRAAADRSSLDLARRIVELAEDKKAADIVLLDVSALTSLADQFVVCSGGSERQIQAIADGIVGGLRDEGIRPIGREGTATSHWVLVDYGDVIVHVFTPPERDFYQLEKHWAEAKTILRVQ
ncbi:MAG: ribosome silencing factor, partial [Candidatus Limnocylindrales bacterium]